MRTTIFTTGALLTMAAWGNGTAVAQPSALTEAPAKSPVFIETRGQKVAMRDGVELSVDIYRPDVQEPLPVIFVLTPYSNDGRLSAGGWDEARWFAERGYAVAIADMRGRFDSDGKWEPFDPKHKTDGYDLVEWLARQSWSNGRVGMKGTSFDGWTQWFTASMAPPSLKAIVPNMAPPDPMWNIPYQQGLMMPWFLDWAAWMSGRTFQVRSKAGYGGFSETRFKDAWKGPYVDINKRRGMLDSPWFEKLIVNNISTSKYFADVSYQGPEGYSKITVPSLNFTGWFDVDQPGSPMNYMGMKRYGATAEARSPRLIIGPWPHGWPVRKVGNVDYGPEALAVDFREETLRWFDHYLKKIDNGVEKDPPVRVFVMGPNIWRNASDWPLPETRWTKYYLASGGNANSLSGDGVLTTQAPRANGSDSYIYDPGKPTLSPWTGGEIEDGAVDARKPESGREVLVYTTPPLTEDTEVIGPIQIKLFAATSARDTDWIVHLVDVHPDGYAALLTEGVMRARYRDPARAGAFNPAALSTIEPGKVYEYTIDFWRATGNLFRKGHRIRIDVQSSYYPYYLRNLNTGADNNGLVDDKDAVVARQKIYHGSRYPSHIVLPVIPSGDAEPR
ncbi:hypothetical protein SAMIE_1022720 [Sphingobium amiense]|uniref:Xaa-Pro dipeptidyl-peptidase C-terminal domain-containing protein n=1 Tax=Sphingobium amiense TaxID=135719 RepID=A0A494W3G7_9SPHN|nr:CocE/NonD family hydrolase [Sphingobium amiense]BBD98771.1 hypothetical protein SAMIE_1022720 [Sphingobium amiense]